MDYDDENDDELYWASICEECREWDDDKYIDEYGNIASLCDDCAIRRYWE